MLAPQHLQRSAWGQAAFTPAHLVPSRPQQCGTRDMQLEALKRQLSQPETLPLLSPHLSQQQQH